MSTLDICGSISSNEQVSTSEWIRSRAVMAKWFWHFGQTLLFSSSSLSKTMVEHFGHLVQRPSGISFLRDLVPASFGFFANVFSVVGGGGGVTAGDTAGSEVSSVSVFLVKVVVAMGVPID